MDEDRNPTIAPLLLTVRGRTKPGKRDELLALFEQQLAPRAEKNASQRLVVWASDADDADGFSLVEIYDNPAAAAANAQAPWFGDYMEASMVLLDGPPSMSTGTPRWVKGVKL
jgi:quinol monooxygenase YgiN